MNTLTHWSTKSFNPIQPLFKSSSSPFISSLLQEAESLQKKPQKQLGITYKTAWCMGYQIRKHMSQVDGDNKLSGVIKVDKTYIGDKRKSKSLL